MKKILIVEDIDLNIDLLTQLLEDDYEISVAKDGAQGVKSVNESLPDLILMDIQMPDMDGLEATTRIRAQDEFTHIPIIALTALAMPGDRERCIEAGASEYLSKPVSMKQLVHMIQSQLQEAPVMVN